MKNLIEIKNLTKTFGSVKALDNINLSIREGEIHGLIGTNGSGKSTLLNILFGNPIIEETGGYKGEIYLDKKGWDPFQNKFKSNFGMIHQEFILIPKLSAWENIVLGKEIVDNKIEKYLSHDLSSISIEENKISSYETLKELGIEIDVSTKVEDLSTNIKQFLEIAREIRRSNLKVLFLDEPTATLNKSDSDILLKTLRSLAKKGLTIIFISHRLDEVSSLCDRVSIIRDGRLISNYERKEFEIELLSSDMIGSSVNKSMVAKRIIKKDPILSLKDFGVNMSGDLCKNINLDIFKGEILGISSLSGHGKLSIGHGIGGLIPTKGKIIFKNSIIDPANISKNMRNGLVVLTEDRKKYNLLLDHSVDHNIIFSNILTKGKFLKGCFLSYLGLWDTKKIESYVANCIKNYDIKISSLKQKVRELSGGNQQKVCIARALSLEPELLFIGEPTRGIDISAKEKVLKSLVDINRKNNTTIVIASSETEELNRICDRIIVLYDGEISHIIEPSIESKSTDKEIKYA